MEFLAFEIVSCVRKHVKIFHKNLDMTLNPQINQQLCIQISSNQTFIHKASSP